MRSTPFASCVRGAVVAAVMIAGVAVVQPASAQRRGGGPGAAASLPSSPRQAALNDLTGYWVSVVSEDWRLRMLTPPRGDVTGVPVNEEGRKVAAIWDPDKDRAGGDPCKAYGAPALMRIPGRLHITWQDDATLKVDADAGGQVRRLQFGATPSPSTPQLQGHSAATWEREGGRGGTLKVVTTGLLSGYLRKNGVPYSERTVLTEYFDRYAGPGGEWLTITTIVSDPVYLQREYVTSTDFRREPDGSKWSPAPCETLVVRR